MIDFLHPLARAVLFAVDELADGIERRAGEMARLRLVGEIIGVELADEVGKRLRYFPDIIVHHDQVDKHVTLALAARAAKYGRGFGALLRKHDYGFVYLLYRLARPLASTVLAVLKGDWPMVRYKWAWLMGIAQGYGRWISVSKGLPSSTANQPSSPSADAPTMLSYSEK